MGPYDGLAGSAVDRIGRNAVDVLNTAYTNHRAGRLLVTADHVGLWDLTDQNQESELLLKSMGAQMEHRAIKKRNQDETLRARAAGQPKQMPSYGYLYVRLVPTGKVDHVALDPIASEIIRNVAERILADETGTITVATEAIRLTRAGVPSPSDRRAQLYGRPLKGNPWGRGSLEAILTSEAALGYLMHGGRPVLGRDGRPVRLADPLWDRATRDALIIKTAPKSNGSRAPKGLRLLTGRTWCGNCGIRLYIMGNSGELGYGCTARTRGVPTAANCKPAPSMEIKKLDGIVEEWFLTNYGDIQVMHRVYDPGTGYAAQITALEDDRAVLREDRKAGLYRAADDAEWYRREYARMGDEIEELKALPDRAPGMRVMPTGRKVADDWRAARDDTARREILTSFDVRVTIFPRGAEKRYAITGMNPYAVAA